MKKNLTKNQSRVKGLNRKIFLVLTLFLLSIIQQGHAQVQNLNTLVTYSTIQLAIDDALTLNGQSLSVSAGNYDEDVNVTKSLTIVGAGSGTTSIRGVFGGSGSTVTISANNIDISGFTVTRLGNNVADWNNANGVLNSAGISIQGQSLSGTIIHDNIISGNRSGIDINNSNSHTIRNNDLTNNRTGIIFRNQTDNISFEENNVTNNWTAGVLFLDGSGGTNVPVQSATNCSFKNNNFSGNWYGQIVERQSGGTIPTPGTNLKNFSGNWLGTITPIVTTANSTEPGYAAQIPVEFGGSAVAPGGQPDIAGPASANIDYTPFLNSGTDVNVETVLSRGTNGFQGNYSTLWVAAASSQVSTTGRIQEGVNLVTSGGAVNALAGSYNERLTIDRSITIQGVNNVTTIVSGNGLVGSGSGFYINNGITNVTIKDLTIQNFVGSSPNSNAGIYGSGGNNNLTLTNNIIKDNVGGSGIYANGPINAVLIDGNTVSGHTNVAGAARGIVIWNGLKSNITITNNEVFNNNCCGIELQDGTSSGVTMTNNNVHDNADNGFGLVGMNGVTGANLISSNTITNNGRFGIEVKNPNANGANSGTGSTVIQNNIISLVASAGMNNRDHAGISVYRRGFTSGNPNGYPDVPTGVVVSGNSVTGYKQLNPSSTESKGYGIVIEGTNHVVTGNTLTNNDVAVQEQGGAHPNANYVASDAGDGNQTDGFSTNYFGRGNAPIACSNTISGNTFTGNTSNFNSVTAPGMYGQVTNTTTGKIFCSIQSAINDAQTLNGHTLLVAAGTYIENVVVTKELTIAGSGQATTKVIPALSGATCGGGSLCAGASNVFLIQANNVTIHDLTVDGNNPSITSGVLAGVVDVEARNGIITNHNLGVYQNLNVHNVTIQNIYLRGIYASTGGSFDFSNNTVTNVQGDPGSIAMFNFGGSGVFANNTLSNVADAIASNWSTGTVYHDNTISDFATALHTDNNGGFGGIADTIRNNTVLNSKTNGYGIMVFAPFLPSVVKSNTVTNTDVGLTLAGQNAIVTPLFTMNDVNGQSKLNATGVYVTTSEFGSGSGNVNGLFTNNFIRNNTDGFYIEYITGYTNIITVNSNSITGNTNGITIGTSTGTFANDFNCNYWGSTSASGVAAAVTALGINYTPWSNSAVDNDLVTEGFQPVPGSCNGTLVTLSASVTNQSCTNLNDGAVDLTVSGGTGPFTYAWNNSASSQDLTGVTSGNYTVLVTDFYGTTATATYSVLAGATPTIWYLDNDGDTYGNPSVSVLSCVTPPLYVANNVDCDDSNFSTHPGAIEVCGDGIDNNCNGFIDEGCVCFNPPTALAGNDQNVCVGLTVSLSGAISGSATNATWSSSGTGSFSPSSAALNATYIPSLADYTFGSVTLSLTTDAVLPCTPGVDQLVVIFLPLPASTGLISGTQDFCNPSSSFTTSYSISSVPGASVYAWSVPAGVNIISGQGSTTLTISFINSFIHNGIGGLVSVVANTSNGCGSSIPSTLAITAHLTAPIQPGSISGPDKACPGDLATYSSAIVARAVKYNWSVPAGVTILTGINTNIITVQYNGAFTSGIISVSATNACGTGAARTRLVNLNVLTAPVAINGLISGLCSMTAVPYSISAPITGASSYLWTVPAGASIIGSNTGSSIVVDYTGSFTGGNVTVAALNNCGAGSVRSITVIGAPAFPGNISGSLAICTGVNSSYGISTITGTITYTWTVTRGLTIVSGQGTKTIIVNAGVPVTGQTMTVKASNACGTTNVRVLDNIAASTCPRIAEDAKAINLIAYPNPVSDKLLIQFNSNDDQNYKVQLMDATSRLVSIQTKSAITGENKIEMNVKGLARGIYLLQFQMADHIEQLRIVIE